MTGGTMDPATILQAISIWGVPVLIAITFHEAAHGFVAKRCGDNTAWMLGRVTLNPIKHIDPFGTILMPLALYMFSGFMLGYAKPVPVNFLRLRDIKWDTVRVAAAGPLMNVVLAIISVVLLWVALILPPAFAIPLAKMLGASVVINIILMAFNLIPILPLDGGRILHALLPTNLQIPFGQTERYGIFIVLGLAFMGFLGVILMPALNLFIGALNHLSPINLFMLINGL